MFETTYDTRHTNIKFTYKKQTHITLKYSRQYSLIVYNYSTKFTKVVPTKLSISFALLASYYDVFKDSALLSEIAEGNRQRVGLQNTLI